ncbi:lysine 5,6-aminomutase reactivase ATPase KamC [Anaerosalibacter sp. Marseille-P3206]|uniref:lysine 5,6-aminomutase reactivase ATPase KamC n=1 Tax=Anaerosalibacter sp. Marseille-P3206 TaxID=1871005 RepID=UPI000987C0F9|nr:DNA mismatch repair protein MutS [Anaerosalibacter sp. Marseille-P3206]
MEFLDNLTSEALDFPYILSNIKTLTPYGKTYKDQLRPYLPGEEASLVRELDKIDSVLKHVQDSEFKKDIKGILVHIKDLRTSVKRTMEGSVLNEVELFELKNFVFFLRDLEKIIKKYNLDQFEDIEIKRIEKLEKLLDPEDTKIWTFYIYDVYSDELKRIREQKRQTEKQIKIEKKALKVKIKEELQLDLRPDGTLVISKEDADNLQIVEKHPNLSYISETYMNVKFTIKPTEEISELDRKLVHLKEREELEEFKIREKLSGEIANCRKALFRNMASIGKLDLILGKAQYAVDINGVRPEISENHHIYIESGRHPKVEEFLRKKGLEFTPITIELDKGVTCITGANMGGKTISLKLVGLLASMAQYGLFVPAKKMSLGLSNFVSTSIGDMQSTDKGLSTFGGEIKLVQEAIMKADKKGIILVDELARGTNPEEGYAISKAVVKDLKDKDSITLVTTHYDNIANLEGVLHLQVVGLSKIDFDVLDSELKDVDADKMDIINRFMDYRLKVVERTSEVPRDAINIARLMGLEEKIIEDALKILEEK